MFRKSVLEDSMFEKFEELCKTNKAIKVICEEAHRDMIWRQ